MAVRPVFLYAAVALGLAGCGFAVEGAASPDLSAVLAQAPDGFSAVDAEQPPDTVCPQSRYDGGEGPPVPDALGEPTSAAFGSADDAELHVWVWRAGSAEAATGYVDRAVADLDGCAYEIYVDSDTDGDGRIDSGGSQTQTAEPWSDAHWTGLAVSGRSSGNGSRATESRYVRSGDVVLLAVLTVHGTDDAAPVLDGYLDTIGAQLG
jgi:hypothetical protein